MSVKPHAFVAMPFGKKPAWRDPNDNSQTPPVIIDFDRVYREYIKPALEMAGLEPFRADEERRGGDILPDMFQELLVADLVVADLTIDNPNVWYELGVRHALRARGIVLVSGGRVSPAFDTYTQRKLQYSLKDGAPDPAFVQKDIENLAEMVKATMDAWHGQRISPVYQLLDNLEEPEWKRLRMGSVVEFWESHEKWEQRIELTRKARQIGDLLVLANEAPIAAFRVDAWIIAGKALRRLERFQFALEHLEHGLARDPRNLELLRETGICLQRLAIAGLPGHSLERARQHYRNALTIHPRDAETWALLGRVDKDAWIAEWDKAGPEEKRVEASFNAAFLREAIDNYTKAYRTDPSHYYSGINALTLMHLHHDLTRDKRYDAEMDHMAGAVRFAAESELKRDPNYYASVTLGDLEVVVGSPETVTTAYLEAVARANKDWFALNSSRSQLQLLKDLNFRPEHVQAGLKVFDRTLEKIEKPNDWQPRQVILFSGHVIDVPGKKPRFPADKESIAAGAIDKALDDLGAGPEDLALCQAAAGGDLLFLEACLKRGIRCQLLLPFPEPEFITKSILPSAGGVEWRGRYFAIKPRLDAQEQQFADRKQPRLVPIRIMSDELGPLPAGVDPFERCNLWLLYTTLSWGVPKARFVCLWNGEPGEGPGGTEHMYAEVEKRTGQVTWIDTRKLWNVAAAAAKTN
jgi:tetratricopeptide (TPR) repeat protein